MSDETTSETLSMPDGRYSTLTSCLASTLRIFKSEPPGVSGKIFAKLGENGVNIRMITQGPEELNIIVGVEEKDFEQAIRVLYNSFVKENVV